MALTDSVLGVEKDNVDEFIGNLFKFDKDNFSEITKLVFGDNLVAILNTNGTFETYGLELTTTKRWKKVQVELCILMKIMFLKHLIIQIVIITTLITPILLWW